VKKVRFVWSVTDAAKVKRCLRHVTGDAKERQRVAVSCGIEIEDAEISGAFRLALDEAGVYVEVREIEEELPPEAGDLDVSAAAGDLYDILMAIPDDADRVKVWLDACEAAGDPAVLDLVVEQLRADACPTHLLAIVEDRARALKRPGPGETRVLEERTADLDVQLSEEEILDRYEKGSATLESADTLAETAKQVSASWKARIQVAKDEGRRLLGEARSGKAIQPVEVRDVLDYGTGRVLTVRMDTGVAIAEREARHEELQLPLLFHSEDE